MVYFFANLSNIVYYHRFVRDRFHITWNLLVSASGIAVQLLLIWQLVIKELWEQRWFGWGGQWLIVVVSAATAWYASRICRRAATNGRPQPCS